MRRRIFQLLVACSLFLLWGWYGVAMGAEGYAIRGNQVVINTKAHWSKWVLPHGALDMAADGTLTPTYLRKDVNAALDAGDFIEKYREVKQDLGELGKLDKLWDTPIMAVGSEEKDADAIHILDGDPDTYWEPSAEDPLFRWWVEVDLGRVVSAHRIVLRFVDEGKGDPFRQFKVFASVGWLAFLGSKSLDYTLVGKTTKPNEDQRVFEFSLEPDVFLEHATTNSGWKAAPDWTGDAIRFIRINVTARKEDEEGRPVGHPRLAEIEVWTDGDNIMLDAVKRGGSVTEPGIGGAWGAADGSFFTSWDAYAWSPYRPRAVMFVDLGATFWADSYRVISKKTRDNKGYLYGYIIRGSDGSKSPDGSLIWQTLSPKEREDNNQNLFYFMGDSFDLRKIRYIDMRNYDVTGARAGAYGAYGSVNEFMLFGEGYVPNITLTSPSSPPIELGGVRNITTIEWDADIPDSLNTRIDIQTRTGDELKEIKHFFDKGGTERTPMEWNKLPAFQRGDVTVEYVPGADWSPWSPVYEQPGAAITSPSPRKYLMIRARLLSDDPELFATLRSIAINFVDPVAKKVVGEIRPSEVEAAISRDFSFYIRPVFSARTTKEKESMGFDEVLIQAPPSVEMTLEAVRRMPDEAFLRAQYGHLLNEEELEKLAGRETEQFAEGEGLERIPTGSDSIFVRLKDTLIKIVQDETPLMYTRLVRETFLDEEGEPLDSLAYYRKVKASERGSIRYLRVTSWGREEQISKTYYDSLSTRYSWDYTYTMKYYRLSDSAPEEVVAFDEAGDPLTKTAYNRLNPAEKGQVTGLGDLVEVQFRSAVYLNGSVFKASVAHSGVPNSWQRVDVGDATDLAWGQTATVSVPVRDALMGRVVVVPEVITPNGDGSNDRASIQFVLLKVNEARKVRVKIYDLDGRVVKDLPIPARENVSGNYQVVWEGDDASGEVVSPGAYLCRISVDADSGEQEAVRVISVAY